MAKQKFVNKKVRVLVLSLLRMPGIQNGYPLNCCCESYIKRMSHVQDSGTKPLTDPSLILSQNLQEYSSLAMGVFLIALILFSLLDLF